VLDLDFSRANTFPQDYDTDLDFEWSNLSIIFSFFGLFYQFFSNFVKDLFADGNDFSWETIQKNRNLYYQQQIANQIITQSIETISLLTAALHIHLNIGQNFTINTSSVFMSLETTSMESLSNKLIQQIENTQIHLPSTINQNNSIVSIQVCLFC
jgi:hypothetical protein